MQREVKVSFCFWPGLMSFSFPGWSFCFMWMKTFVDRKQVKIWGKTAPSVRKKGEMNSIAIYASLREEVMVGVQSV